MRINPLDAIADRLVIVLPRTRLKSDYVIAFHNRGLARQAQGDLTGVRILHFACHAIQRDPMAASFLRVDDGFDSPQLQFEARRFVVGGDPVEILNACRTSNAHPLTRRTT